MRAIAKDTFVAHIKRRAKPNVADGVRLRGLSFEKQFEGNLVARGTGEMLEGLTPPTDIFKLRRSRKDLR